MAVAKTICQVCHNGCPIEVEVVDGRGVLIGGNKSNRHYAGFACQKGREQLRYHYSPDRLLTSRRRLADGAWAPIGSARALDEIADRLTATIDRHGPRSVAIYLGTQAFQSANSAMPVAKGFMAAIDSPMVFDSATIDQPGKATAAAFHGRWLAPHHTPAESDVLMLIGTNPLVSMFGLPAGNHGRWLTDKLATGTGLIVIDPRRTETARRATLFLQPRPGHDVAVLASMLHVILAESLGDQAFADAHVTGVDRLRAAVAPFTPEVVGRRADVDAGDVVRAARMYGSARAGFAAAGTGPNMSQSGSLLEYLILNLGALCGHRRRAGEVVPNPVSLYPAVPAIAQAMAPFPAAAGPPMRVRGLAGSVAGMPTAALADEILLQGEGQVRALLSVGGNPVAAWPDQLRTCEAMAALDLLVQVEPFMSQTARYADYVIAPYMPLEVPHASQFLDYLQLVGLGPAFHSRPTVPRRSHRPRAAT